MADDDSRYSQFVCDYTNYLKRIAILHNNIEHGTTCSRNTRTIR